MKNKYGEYKAKTMNMNKINSELKFMLGEKDREICNLEERYAKLRIKNNDLLKANDDKDGIIQKKDDIINNLTKEKDDIIQEKDDIIQEKDGIIQEKDDIINNLTKEKDKWKEKYTELLKNLKKEETKQIGKKNAQEYAFEKKNKDEHKTEKKRRNREEEEDTDKDEEIEFEDLKLAHKKKERRGKKIRKNSY